MKKAIFISVVITALICLTSAILIPSGSSNATDASDIQQQKKDTLKKATAMVVYTCPMHKDVVQDKPGKCPKCGMNLVKQEVAKVEYTCPMHSEVIQDKPGKCPKCGMNLVKKEVAKK